MTGPVTWLAVLLAVTFGAGASDLCAERLWRELRQIDVADDDSPAAYRHDALIMEIAFLKPERLGTGRLVHVAFAPLVDAHARLHHAVARLLTHVFTLNEPTWRERVTGRASFREALARWREAYVDVRVARAFWSEWDARAGLEGQMPRRLFDVERELAHRARRLIGQAYLAERRTEGFADLARFVARDGRLTRAEIEAELAPYLGREDEQRRHDEVRTRRKALRVIDGDRD